MTQSGQATTYYKHTHNLVTSNLPERNNLPSDWSTYLKIRWVLRLISSVAPHKAWFQCITEMRRLQMAGNDQDQLPIYYHLRPCIKAGFRLTLAVHISCTMRVTLGIQKQILASYWWSINNTIKPWHITEPAHILEVEQGWYYKHTDFCPLRIWKIPNPRKSRVQ